MKINDFVPLFLSNFDKKKNEMKCTNTHIYHKKTQTVTFMQVNVPAEPDAQSKRVTDTIMPTCHGTRAQEDIYSTDPNA